MSDTIRKYLIDTFCDKLQMEAKWQELDKREERIVKVEASQRYNKRNGGLNVSFNFSFIACDVILSL